MNNYLISIIFFTLVSWTSVFAQNNYDLSTADTVEINKAILYCKDNIYIIPQQLEPTLDSILDLSAEMKYNQGLFSANNLMGISAWMKDDFETAYKHYQNALYYSDFLPEPRNKAIALGNLGMYFTNVFQLDSAETYLLKTIDFSQNNGLSNLSLKAKFDLGNLYLQQDQYIKAVDYLFQIKDSLKVNEDKQLSLFVNGTLGVLYSNIGKSELAIESYKNSIKLDDKLESVNIKCTNYLNLGEEYFNRSEMDSALHYYNLAVSTALPHHKPMMQLATTVNIGNIFLETHQFDSCFLYYKKALKNPAINSHPEYLTAATVNMGLYHANKLQYAESKQFLQSGLEMATKLNLVKFEKNALETLYRIDSLQGNFNQAFRYLLAFNNAKDKLEKQEAQLAIAAIDFDNYMAQNNFDNQRLQHENSLQAQKLKNKNNIIIGVLTALFLMLVHLYFSIKNRNKTNKLVVELSQKNNDLKKLNAEVISTNRLLEINEKELEKLNLTKDKFFSILGHDLKSPFSSLLGLLEIIDEQWTTMQDSKKHFLIQKLRTSSLQTYQLLENVLDWGKVQRGQIQRNNQQFNLNQKVQDIVEIFQPQAQTKNISIQSKVATNTILNTDVMLLNQIIQNFVSNAIKFTPKGGKINIDCAEYKGAIRICVTDNGIGIPKNKIANIFDMDLSFNRPGTENEKSTGMGLLLSSEYASILNGKLSATSTENEGSSFCIEIPNATLSE